MTSRRGFLVTLAAAPLSAAVPARRKLHEFAYSDVTLTGGPLADQYRRVHQHFLGLDEDRILKVYRQRVGLPAPGRDMGGWYDANGFVPGHLVGQFVSGLSRIHAHTADPQAAAKARRLFEGYAATFEKDGNPYASPKASTTWPCYILDKYEIGLIDAASLAGIEQARALLPRVIEGALRFIPDHTYDRTPDSPKQAPYDEPYILSENFFRSAELTGDRRFHDMAVKYLLNDEFFNPLSENRNILPGKHGYSHVIALSSGAKAYEVLGDQKYLHAIRNAWDMLEQTQQYASGAWAPKEAFVRPHSGELAASITAHHEHFETPCGYYAHSKLARYLLGFTGDARYGDGLERILFNTILGAIDPDDDGGYFYYSDYHAQAKKGYYQRKWPCCAGTLVQSVADYPLNLYFRGEDGIYVNLFAESEVRWRAGNVPVKLTQRTRYPEAETIEIRVEPDTPADFAVYIRVPGWLEKQAQLAVNGKPQAAPRGKFASIRRRWRRGDKIELTLPFTDRTVPIDDRNPDVVALMHGPLLMTTVEPDNRRLPFYQVRGETYNTYFRRGG